MSLYCIRCKCHIIALLYRYATTIIAKEIVGETTMWRHVDKYQDDGDHGVIASDDGDHDDTLEMEIKGRR